MGLLDLYSETDPLLSALWLCAAFSVLCWLLSVLTREYSWVDRIWSITPVIYTGHFAAHAGFDDARLNVMALLVALWGLRLTYNFARKGGYAPGGEDYRWKFVQDRIGPVGFQVMNATFIAPFQNLLLLLITVPAYLAYQRAGTPLGVLDILVAAAFLLFFLGESVADEQQWKFQSAKYAALARAQRPSANFLTTGLFRFSRHPNFFCEQAMWWTFYFFSVAAGAAWLNWSIVGAALLTALFQGSTWLTERISVEKYPEYGDYQRRTSRLMPWLPGREEG
jgi:steroid 5-alpha reductase family enzyme